MIINKRNVQTHNSTLFIMTVIHVKGRIVKINISSTRSCYGAKWSIFRQGQTEIIWRYWTFELSATIVKDGRLFRMTVEICAGIYYLFFCRWLGRRYKDISGTKQSGNEDQRTQSKELTLMQNQRVPMEAEIDKQYQGSLVFVTIVTSLVIGRMRNDKSSVIYVVTVVTSAWDLSYKSNFDLERGRGSFSIFCSQRVKRNNGQLF